MKRINFAVLFFLLLSATNQAQENFYQGRTIRIVIGSSPGGGYDLWARFLAQYFGRHITGRPDVIVQKKPSADLWADQTDEGELGFSYRDVDRLLYLMVDERYSCPELIAAGFAAPFVDEVTLRIMNSQFKRRLPVIAKVSERTIDRDFRYARDWGK